MNKLLYVEHNEDQIVFLRDDETRMENIIKLVRELFDRGVKFVGFENDLIKIYFDSAKDLGFKQISGKFKDRVILK